MKNFINKFFGTFILNALLAIAASFGLILQEVNLQPTTIMTMVLFGISGSVGGSLLGEALSVLISKRGFSYFNFFMGIGIGVLASVILALKLA